MLAGTDVLTWWGHVAHDEVTDDVVERVHRRVLDGMGLVVLHSGHFSRIFRRLMGTSCDLKWREDGRRERMWVVDPSHPIADGLGESIVLGEEEMYGEHFDIPAPDELVLVSWFEGGEVFRSGCTWRRGRGRVVYLRPGHETHPTYFDPGMRRLIANGVRWAVGRARRRARRTATRSRSSRRRRGGGRMLSEATIREAPKALLHDHLDGGLRPATIVDLAREYGHELPTEDVDDLTTWFHRGADQKSLELYLETFEHTFGVMQEKDAIARVASECAQDLAADGVVYAEVRMAPELCTERGLTLDEAVEAMLEGFARGTRQAALDGHTITVKLLVTAMRQAARSVEVAACAVRWRDAGVVGFDIAGPEAGYPPTRHLDAFDLVRRENFHITIHAGESFGLPSIWEALQFCGAERLGHGVRIVDDITVHDDGSVSLGRLAAFVRDRRVPLEMCPTSNVHTGGAPSIAEHPFDLLRRLRFRVTVNTDNRLMSGVSATSELAALDEAFNLGLGEMEWLTINALKSAFAPFDERLRLINEVVKPGYAHLRAEALRVHFT